MATDEAVRPPQGPTPLINDVVLEAHLALLSTLDRHRLLDTLVPHRDLPDHDIAGYIIDAHGQDERDGNRVGIRTPYGLGVVFARSLVSRAQMGNPEGELPPIITEMDEGKKELVDKYLRESAKRTVKRLTRRGEQLHPNLDKAVAWFVGRCEDVLPDKMLADDSQDELRRGAHDFFSVFTLLESDALHERQHLRRRLGGTLALGGLLVSVVALSRRPHQRPE